MLHGLHVRNIFLLTGQQQGTSAPNSGKQITQLCVEKSLPSGSSGRTVVGMLNTWPVRADHNRQQNTPFKNNPSRFWLIYTRHEPRETFWWTNIKNRNNIYGLQAFTSYVEITSYTLLMLTKTIFSHEVINKFTNDAKRNNSFIRSEYHPSRKDLLWSIVPPFTFLKSLRPLPSSFWNECPGQLSDLSQNYHPPSQGLKFGWLLFKLLSRL